MPLQIRPRELVRALERLGWYVDRQRGSHVILRRVGSPGHISVPVHGGRTLRPGTLHFILKQAGISEAELQEAL